MSHQSTPSYCYNQFCIRDRKHGKTCFVVKSNRHLNLQQFTGFSELVAIQKECQPYCTIFTVSTDVEELACRFLTDLGYVNEDEIEAIAR